MCSGRRERQPLLSNKYQMTAWITTGLIAVLNGSTGFAIREGLGTRKVSTPTSPPPTRETRPGGHAEGSETPFQVCRERGNWSFALRFNGPTLAPVGEKVCEKGIWSYS